MVVHACVSVYVPVCMCVCVHVHAWCMYKICVHVCNHMVAIYSYYRQWHYRVGKQILPRSD